MGKSMENPWKTMEFYQKSVEISEKSMGKRGKPMESHLEFRKIRLKIRGTFGNSMAAWKRFNISTGNL